MKTIRILTPFVVLLLGLFIVKNAEAACVTMNVTLANDANWPAGESVNISCVGDTGTAGCVGDSTSIKPGETKTLSKCTCPEAGGPAGSGCVVVDSKPNKCSAPAVGKTNYCKTNGNTVTATLQASCEAPPPPPGECTPGDTRTTPQCNKCDVNGKWKKDYSVGDWKTCFCQDNPDDATCKDPVGVCTPGDVQKLPEPCRVCDVNGKWQKDYTGQDWQACKCIDSPDDPACKTTGPDPDPNPDPDPDPDPSVTQPDVSQPPVSQPPGQPPVSQPPVTQPPATATPVPPTPTPDPYNEAMCKCDTMSVSQIIAGQAATFTANGKVEGTDTTYAQIREIEFLLSSGNNPASRKRIAGPERVAATITSQTATKVQYQSQWTVDIPSTVQRNTDYIAQATVKCARKTNAMSLPFTATVMGASSESRGFFGTIIEFFSNLFNRGSSQQTAITPSPAQDEEYASIEGDNLQLDSFAPARVTETTCNAVKFRF